MHLFNLISDLSIHRDGAEVAARVIRRAYAPFVDLDHDQALEDQRMMDALSALTAPAPVKVRRERPEPSQSERAMRSAVAAFRASLRAEQKAERSFRTQRAIAASWRGESHSATSAFRSALRRGR